MFITFEGGEGGGKSTQVKLLNNHLLGLGYTVHNLREPGSTPIGSAIRDILLNRAHTDLCERAEVLLFNAARAQLVQTTIRPALDRGEIVLCDRYADSTLAYQGYGRGLDITDLRTIIGYATAGLQPDLTVLLDLPVEHGLRRKQAQDEVTRLELEAQAFHVAVRQGFLTLAAQEPHRWLVLDATQTIPVLSQKIITTVIEKLKSPLATIDK